MAVKRPGGIVLPLTWKRSKAARAVQASAVASMPSDQRVVRIPNVGRSAGFNKGVTQPSAEQVAAVKPGQFPTNAGGGGRDAFANGRTSIKRAFQLKSSPDPFPFATTKTVSVPDTPSFGAQPVEGIASPSVKRMQAASKKPGGQRLGGSALTNFISSLPPNHPLQQRFGTGGGVTTGGAGGVAP